MRAIIIAIVIFGLLALFKTPWPIALGTAIALFVLLSLIHWWIVPKRGKPAPIPREGSSEYPRSWS